MMELRTIVPWAMSVNIFDRGKVELELVLG